MNALTSLHWTEVLGFGNLLLVIALVAASVLYLIVRRKNTKYPHVLSAEDIDKTESSSPARV